MNSRVRTILYFHLKQNNNARTESHTLRMLAETVPCRLMPLCCTTTMWSHIMRNTLFCVYYDFRLPRFGQFFFFSVLFVVVVVGWCLLVASLEEAGHTAIAHKTFSFYSSKIKQRRTSQAMDREAAKKKEKRTKRDDDDDVDGDRKSRDCTEIEWKYCIL